VRFKLHLSWLSGLRFRPDLGKSIITGGSTGHSSLDTLRPPRAPVSGCAGARCRCRSLTLRPAIPRAGKTLLKAGITKVR